MLRRLLSALLLILAAARAEAASPVLDVRDPARLAVIEQDGWSFADVLETPSAHSTQALGRDSPAFRTLRDHVAADVKELRADMKANGRPLFEVTDGNVGRVIDLHWLESPIASFRLVGIVNRLDRRDFTDDPASCGEVRFVYRLAYRAERSVKGRAQVYASRLPFSLNVVYDIRRPKEGGCAQAAAQWRAPSAGMPPQAMAAWLRAGPLDRAGLALRQIELNAQIVRFPSGQETEFGGQAVYLMRIFRAESEGAGLKLVPKPLENTPDIARISADAQMKQALVDYVKANLPAIDTGVFRLPEALLATRAFSFSTFGSARLANHPFTALLTETDLDSLDFSGLPFIGSVAGLKERLDNASCMGCHQSGGTAGFHFFGTDEAGASDYNRVLQGVSPHYHAEQSRRAAYVEAVASGREPNRFRPLSGAPPADWSAQGGNNRIHCTDRSDRPSDCTDYPPGLKPARTAMPCLAQASNGAFKQGWSCGRGQVCEVIGANRKLAVEFGQCMPASEKAVFSGLACLRGDIETGREPYLDRWKKLSQINSFAEKPTPTAFNCRPPRIGVPGGLAYRRCSPADKAFAGLSKGSPMPAEICGLAGGRSFDDCVATNDFATCYKASVVRGMRPACGANSFCREDFMCQAIPADIPGAEALDREMGFCSPTYFLFQMRIDGHPDPLRTTP